MLDYIYQTLASLGFTHPLHPIVTHLPMGMAIGAFLFEVASFKKEELSKTALHCLILGLLFVPLSALLGIMDWQYRYLGKLSNLIIAKMILASVLMVIMTVTIYSHRKGVINRTVMMVLYSLNLMAAMPLGFLGGQLIFG